MNATVRDVAGSVRILVGDVRERLRELPDDYFDCVVTSPPYWGLRDYGTATWEGGDTKCDHIERMSRGDSDRETPGGKGGSFRASPMQYRSICARCSAVRIDQQIGLEPTLGEHLDVLVDVFREVRRVMKPSGTLWINYGDCYATKPNGRSAEATKAAGNDDRTFRDKPFSTIGPVYGHLDIEYEKTPRAGATQNLGNLGAQTGPRVVGVGLLKPKDLCMIPNRLAIALQDDGWWVRSEIVWGKPNPMPDSSGRYRPSTAHEKIWLLTKSAKSCYDWEAVALPCSPNTNARLAQDVQNQIGSERANGGRKTNGNMKAVAGRKMAEPGSGVRNNSSMDEALALMPETRFLRNYEPAPLIAWEIPTAAFSGAHFATFPPELAERCIKAGCPVGGHVLDPFGGAGTTGMVADRLGRYATLIELNPESVEMSRERIADDAGMFTRVDIEPSHSRTGVAS